MERPRNSHEQEQPPASGEIIAVADALLELKNKDSPLTCVDIVLQNGTSSELYDELADGPFGKLLAAPDQQLALESNGYYPELDVRKSQAQFRGMGLRVYGWDYDEFAHRRLEVAISYQADDTRAIESVSLDAIAGHEVSAASSLWISQYAETGYEGHGGTVMQPTEEDVSWLLDYVARHVGDEPKSVEMAQLERIQTVRERAAGRGFAARVDALVEQTWPAQALYLMTRRTKKLGGKSVWQALASPDVSDADIEAVFEYIEQSRDKKN